MTIVPESIQYHIGRIPAVLLMSWLAWIFLLAVSVVLKRTYRFIPNKVQSIAEICMESVYKLADELIGEGAHKYYPLFLGVFLFVLTGNIMGLVPGLISPTADINVTISLSVAVFLYYNIQGFREQGPRYLLSFFGPSLPWYLFPVRLLMFVIEIISHFARPFSMSLRLFCNIFSKEILLGLLAMLLLNFFVGHTAIEKGLSIAPLLLRPLIILLGLLIGFIQALIFLVLSITYVAGAVQQEAH